MEAIHAGASTRLPAGQRLATLAAMASAALAALAIQSLWIPVDADVSWLITVAERVLSGDRLYVDIIEVNPPASVWMYVPSVLLANLLAIRPEAMVVATFIAASFVSVKATLRLASRLDDAPPAPVLAAALSLVALVLPMALFAQREHAALLLALPAIAAIAVIAEGKRVAPAALHASGLAAGLIVVIKPHFALAIIAPAIWAAWRRRSISPLLAPAAAAAALVAFYGIALVTFAAAYFDWVPVLAHSYAAMRAPWWKVLIGPSLYPAICLGLVVLLRAPRTPPLAIAWALGAAGFIAAAFLQGKNYPNHWLPQAGLALAAGLAVLVVPRISAVRRAAVGIGLVVVAACVIYYWTIVPDPAVASEIRRVAPPRPAIAALSPQLTTGHPVTRNVGGEWVGSRAGLFTASAVKAVGLSNEQARSWYRDDIDAFVTEVARHSPDVVLVHRPSKKWLLGEPAIVRAMQPYERAASTRETEIWVRRSRPR